MKVTALGCSQMSGKSGKTGRDYVMSRLYVASEKLPEVHPNRKIQGAGFEGHELEIPEDLYLKLATTEYPVVLELATEDRMTGGRMIKVTQALKNRVKPRLVSSSRADS